MCSVVLCVPFKSTFLWIVQALAVGQAALSIKRRFLSPLRCHRAAAKDDGVSYHWV